MLSIQKFKRLQEKQRQATQDALFPTGIVIDITGPQGNIFYLMGLCKSVQRRLEFSQEDIDQFNAEMEPLLYDDRLKLMQKWFGFTYITQEDK